VSEQHSRMAILHCQVIESHYRHTSTISTDATGCGWDWSYTGTASATLQCTVRPIG